jgi:hypothetical protein
VFLLLLLLLLLFLKWFGKSCVDYIIVSEDIVNNLNFLHVLPPNELSDHCIIWFSLKTPNSLDSITKCKQDDIYTYSIPGKFCVDNGKSRVSDRK